MKGTAMKFERGDSITFGKKWCKEHNSKHLIGKTIMMTPQWFEEDNGLYCSDTECPGILEANSDVPDSIYHLFGNNFEWFMDCKLIKGTEEDKARYEGMKQERFEAETEYYKKMSDAFENEFKDSDSTAQPSEAAADQERRNTRMYNCSKCGWEGKKPATMGAAGLKLKVCQNCLSRTIDKVSK